MSNQKKADIALLFVTIGWGSSFILTKNALSDLTTFNFLAIRFFIAFVISALFFYKRLFKVDRTTLKYGVILGIVLFSSYAFQTIGINYTTASKSAFITGFAVVLVPIVSGIIYRTKIPLQAKFGVVLSIVGLSLLTLKSDLTLGFGDMVTMFCTIIFAMHIILTGQFTDQTDSVMLGIIQIGVVALMSACVTLTFESPIIPTGNTVWINLLILAIVCTSGAYIVQSVAQRYTSSTHTALIYAGEPVFAAIFAYFTIGEVLSFKGILGASLVLFGMILGRSERI